MITCLYFCYRLHSSIQCYSCPEAPRPRGCSGGEDKHGWVCNGVRPEFYYFTNSYLQIPVYVLYCLRKDVTGVKTCRKRHLSIYLFISKCREHRRGLGSSEEPLELRCSLQRADRGVTGLWLGHNWRKFRRKCCSCGLTLQLPVREQNHVHWFGKTVKNM